MFDELNWKPWPPEAWCIAIARVKAEDGKWLYFMGVYNPSEPEPYTWSDGNYGVMMTPDQFVIDEELIDWMNAQERSES